MYAKKNKHIIIPLPLVLRSPDRNLDVVLDLFILESLLELIFCGRATIILAELLT